MNFRNFFVLWLAAFVFCSGPAARSTPATPSAGNLIRLHWLGLNQISADTNAAQFMTVWKMPQTTALVAQTLDKLSCWPGCGATNAAAASLRPLLNDLVSNECVLEIRASADAPFNLRHSQITLAVRLPADRAAFWRTNLAVACAGLTGLTPESKRDGWTLARPAGRIELAVNSSWTLIGCGLDLPVAKSSVARNPASGFGALLEAELSPAALAAAIGVLEIPAITNLLHGSSLPAAQVTVTGANGDLHTHATLMRGEAFHLDLPAWDIPTNLIHGPVTSFGIARGFGGWLAAQPGWQKTGFSPAPDQLVYWARDGIPFQTYVVAPFTGVSNQLARLYPQLVQFGNPWLATNADGNFEWSTEIAGIIWKNANIATPFVYGDEFNHRSYLIAGLYPPLAGTPQLPPVRVLKAIHDRPDLVFAELEGTGSRVEDGFWINQNFRIVFHKPQMPHEGVGTQWLKKAEHSFGETFTCIYLAGPRRLEFERDSTIGLNALELHLLADWLESPQFPRGLHTFLAPPDKQP